MPSSSEWRDNRFLLLVVGLLSCSLLVSACWDDPRERVRPSGDDDDAVGDDDDAVGDDDDDVGDDDDSDPGDTLVCPAGEVPDCNDNCAPAMWLGDKYCDSGVAEWPEGGGGALIYFDCATFANDAGDCGLTLCPEAGLIPNCDESVCVSPTWLGDSTCDDTDSSSSANLNCSQLNFDAGDCQ